MDIQLVLTVLDRRRRRVILGIYEEAGAMLTATMLGRGTAPPGLLDRYGLEATDKAIVGALIPGDKRHGLFRAAKHRMMIDVPGNGVMLAVPLKSVGGRRAMSYLLGGSEPGKGVPDMSFTHELVVIISNQGYTDDVMAAAREAGASGGTVVHAKGTGGKLAERFLGVSLAEEKELVLIAAAEADKSAIMRAVASKAGPGTEAGAICFSLPISEIVGIRMPDAE